MTFVASTLITKGRNEDLASFDSYIESLKHNSHLYSERSPSRRALVAKHFDLCFLGMKVPQEVALHLKENRRRSLDNVGRQFDLLDIELGALVA